MWDGWNGGSIGDGIKNKIKKLNFNNNLLNIGHGRPNGDPTYGDG